MNDPTDPLLVRLNPRLSLDAGDRSDGPLTGGGRPGSPRKIFTVPRTG